MACAWGLLVAASPTRWKEWALRRLGTLLLGALSYHFWWHSAVSEMYALNVFFLAALLWAYASLVEFLLWAFIFKCGTS